MYNTCSNDEELVGMLVEAGASVNVRTGQGHTGLMIACENGFYSVAKLLASQPSSDLGIQVLEGECSGMVSSLLFSTKDSAGNTAMHHAVYGGKNESIVILLDAGADPTVLNQLSLAPIHEAAKTGCYPLVHWCYKVPALHCFILQSC